MGEEAALREAERRGIIVTDGMRIQLERYLEMILSQNARVNLTRILDPDEIWIKHFYDSWALAAVPDWNGAGRLVDVGSGAGFPGIPIKILYPDLEVVLLDSMGKRVEFLRYVIEALDLKGIRTARGRAEELARGLDYRESFDWVVSRAVADLSVLAEYCLPFASLGGWFAAYKGPDPRDEIVGAGFAIESLGGRLRHCYDCALPLGYGERNLVAIRKEERSPGEYPRKSGIPAKKPLRGH
jgi:16S rRNA (guanine527-N7)-methyltransferase